MVGRTIPIARIRRLERLAKCIGKYSHARIIGELEEARAQFALITKWHVEAPLAAVWDAIYDADRWPERWLYVLKVRTFGPAMAMASVPCAGSLGKRGCPTPSFRLQIESGEFDAHCVGSLDAHRVSVIGPSLTRTS